MTRCIKNARIESTTLGNEGHGIAVFVLHLNYDGGGQGFGLYPLDSYDDQRKDRIGTAWGMEAILRIIEVVGVNRWEELPGKHVRADADDAKVYRIGHIIEDRWFDPHADLDFLAKKGFKR